MSSSTPWTCPVCLRRVPGRVEECYCGLKRSQLKDEEAEAKAGPSPWTALLVLLLGAGGGWYLLASGVLAPPEATLPSAASRMEGRPPPPPERAARETGVQATPVPTPTPTPDLSFFDEEAEATPTATPTATPLAAAPTPSPEEELSRADSMREEGLRSFEQALARLEAKRLDLEDRVTNYVTQCRAFVNPMPDPVCVRLQQEIGEHVTALREGIERAEDEARRAWIEPGARRDLRAQRGLDEGRLDALLLEAQQAAR